MSVRVAKSGLYAWDDTKTTGEREWREVPWSSLFKIVVTNKISQNL